MGISTHVVDTSAGRPGEGMPVTLERKTAGCGWETVCVVATDSEGRVRQLVAEGAAEPGLYRIGFDTEAYFNGRGARAFFPFVLITFEVDDPSRHYHVPLLVSPYGYSTHCGR